MASNGIYTLLRLVPFFSTVVIYFLWLIPSSESSVKALIIKCLPILCLNIFIVLTHLDNRERITFKALIFMGLIFSCFGDAFLVWNNMFIYGMISFAIGHIFYIIAFGVSPLKPLLGAALLIPGLGMMVVLIPKLDGVLLYGVPIYTLILLTMTWRALAFSFNSNGPVGFIKLCTGLGAISWAISDGVLGFTDFHSSLPYSQVIIMSTYYFGQLGITVSILSLPTIPSKSLSSKVRMNQKYK